MKNLAKKINESLIENETVKEYLCLKKEIEEDEELTKTKLKLDELRKQICKDKSMDSEEYYLLLENYKNNPKIKKYERISGEIKGIMVDISDILSLK